MYKKLIIIFLLFLTFGCKAYKDWRFLAQQNPKQVDAMNNALYLCNSKWPLNEEFYNRYYQLKANAGEAWNRFATRDDLLYQGFGTRGSQTSYKNAIEDCNKGIDNAFAIYSLDKRMDQESQYAKSIGFALGIFGYQDRNYDAGITSFINYVYNKSKENTGSTLSENIKENQSFLIKANNVDRSFQVTDIVGNYVVYRYFNKDYRLIQVALLKSDNESYLENSPLIGKYFSIVGTKKLLIYGKSLELLVIKRII